MLALDDFDNDSQLDLLGSNGESDYLSILFGNGDATSRTQTVLSTGIDTSPTAITSAEFNGENYLDNAVTHTLGNTVGLFFRNNKRTFAAQMTFSTGRNSFPSSMTITYFNNDGYTDVAIINSINRHVGIFLGHPIGTFQTQNTSFTVGLLRPFYIVMDDFDGDGYQDVVPAASMSQMNTNLKQ